MATLQELVDSGEIFIGPDGGTTYEYLCEPSTDWCSFDSYGHDASIIRENKEAAKEFAVMFPYAVMPGDYWPCVQYFKTKNGAQDCFDEYLEEIWESYIDGNKDYAGHTKAECRKLMELDYGDSIMEMFNTEAETIC